MLMKDKNGAELICKDLCLQMISFHVGSHVKRQQNFYTVLIYIEAFHTKCIKRRAETVKYMYWVYYMGTILQFYHYLADTNVCRC
jgi:hypothetical protein